MKELVKQKIIERCKNASNDAIYTAKVHGRSDLQAVWDINPVQAVEKFMQNSGKGVRKDIFLTCHIPANHDGFVTTCFCLRLPASECR